MNSLPNLPDLYVHFGYHKAMTMYLKQIFQSLAKSLGYTHRHHNSNRKAFLEQVQDLSAPRILSVNNRPIQFDDFPEYLGSHIIRDPRDLLVSAYRYHLWCNEAWATDPMSGNLVNVLNLESLELMDFRDRSYQELLNQCDEITGYTLEFNRMKPVFVQMSSWNYNNPRIKELRYERLYGNEDSTFRELFEFWKIPEKHWEQPLKIVNQRRFDSLQKNQATGPNQHANQGKPGQWKEWLPECVGEKFHNGFSDLLRKLKYE